MAKQIIDIEVKTGKSVKEIDKLAKSVEGVNEEVQDTSKATEEMGSTLDGVSGGAVSKLKGFKTALTGVTTGFKSLRFAIIASGIGALAIAILAVGQAFTRSEEGQNKFAKIMNAIGAITAQVMDLFADLGEAIISAFENPAETFRKFKQAIEDNITTRINGLITLFPKLGQAIQKVFSGDFAEAGKIATDAIGQVVLGMDSVTDSITNAKDAIVDLIDETQKEVDIMNRVSDARALADEVERQLIIDRAKANRDRADLLNKAMDRENQSLTDRIGFLEEAGKIEEEITNKEINLARIRLQATQAEMSLGKDRKEDKDAEAQQIATLLDLETAKLSKAKEVTSQISGLRAQDKAERDAIEAEELAKEELAKEKEAEAFQKELDDRAKAEEQRLEDVEKDRLAKEQKIQDEQDLADKLADIEQQKIDRKKQALDDLSRIAGQETAVGKALLLAKVGLQIQEAIQEARRTITFATQSGARASIAMAEGTAQTAKIGFPQNIPMLIGYAVQAVGIFSSIKSAISSAKKATGLSASTPTAPNIPQVSAPQQAPQASTFNVVGDTGTNQVADAINNQNTAPVQAFVVSSEVSSAQELEDNIVESATLG